MNSILMYHVAVVLQCSYLIRMSQLKVMLHFHLSLINAFISSNEKQIFSFKTVLLLNYTLVLHISLSYFNKMANKDQIGAYNSAIIGYTHKYYTIVSSTFVSIQFSMLFMEIERCQ